MVRNVTRDKRSLRFYGEARIVDGVAVVVRVDRVRAGKFDIQLRA